MVAALDTLSGSVTRVSAYGFQLDGVDTWYNCSKFVPGLTLPEKGESVRIAVNAKGFVTVIEPLSEPEPQIDPDALGPAPAASRPDRETAITRMACLNTATAVLSSGGRAVDADAVLTLAGRLEGWVSR
ncbi:MAG: hypothetical protein ACR2PL_18930 [Dehalococcoidia bacterium]